MSGTGGGDGACRLLYGVNPVLEALRARHRVEAVWVLEGKHAVTGRLDKMLATLDTPPPVERVSARELQRLARTGEHQGLVARAALLPGASLRRYVAEGHERPLVLLLDGIQDPGNLGAIYRVADAAGVGLVFIPSSGSASHQLASVAKASAGAVEHVPTVVVSKLKSAVEELKGHGFRVYALEAGRKSIPIDAVEASGPVALIIGSEGRGVGHALGGLADGYVELPMRGRVNSLNAATATAVAVYAIAGLVPVRAG